MDQNGISEETEGRYVVLELYFSLRSFICLSGMAQYRPYAILTDRESRQKFLCFYGNPRCQETFSKR